MRNPFPQKETKGIEIKNFVLFVGFGWSLFRLLASGCGLRPSD